MNTISKGKRLIFLFCALLAGCTRMNIDVSNRLILPANSSIAVGAFANHSDTPLANRQVESMLVGLLQTKGFTRISHYQRKESCAKLLYCPDETLSKKQIIHWARARHIHYVFMGAVNEWRYKVGLDGEPVAGLSILAIDAHSGRTVWSSVGSAIGGSRSGLDIIGQSLLKCLLASVYPTLYPVQTIKTAATK
ncbi:penicillin-binding protein activator LpoB [Legionella israelensis]|uniref:Penicillin-binding protein activator LpoB n=1 Tax=Legionella israelensis TaxID=454 RepID=A0AAX1EFB9_9GAMM|nr:penicillin-binding protein activator LpoB [Legionella israelensis]QBR83793.1 penicillin-binding protein activator LpoB [Legionella israelensis]